MQIKRISLDGFGCFHNAEFTFRPGNINLIYGHNESGKSTLMASILAILFGLPHPERYQPWAGPETHSGSLEFSVQGSQFSVWRDFNSRKVKLRRHHNDRVIVLFEGTDAPEEGRARPFLDQLSSFMPIVSAELFYKTTFVAQEQLNTDIRDELKELITGTTGRSYSTEMERLKRKHLNLTSENPWSTVLVSKSDKILEKLRSQLSRLSERKVGVEKEIEEGTMLQSLLLRLEKESETLGSEIRHVRSAWEVAGALTRLLTEIEDAKKRIAEIEREEKRVKEFHERQSSLEYRLATAFPELTESAEELEENWSTLKECARNWKRVEALLAAKKDRETQLAERLRKAETEISSRFSDYIDMPEGLIQSIKAHTDLRHELEQKQKRLGSLQTEIDDIQKRIEQDFPEFKEFTESVVPPMRELARLEKEGHAVEERLTVRRQARAEIERRLEEISENLSHAPAGMETLAPDFPLRLSNYLEKKQTHTQVTKRISEEEAALEKLQSKGPVFWSAVFGPLAAAAGAISGYFLTGGDIYASVGLGIGLFAVALAVCSWTGKGKEKERNMIAGGLQGLRWQQEELAAEIEKLKSGLQGFEEARFSEEFERFSEQRDMKQKTVAEVSATADVLILEQDLASRKELTNKLMSKLGLPQDRKSASELLDKAIEHAELLRELGLKQAQLEELLDKKTDKASGKTLTAVELLSIRIDEKAKVLGPLAGKELRQVEAPYSEFKENMSELQKHKNLLEDLKNQRYSELESVKQEIEGCRTRLGALIQNRTSEEVDELFAKHREVINAAQEVRTMINANRTLSEIQESLGRYRGDLKTRSQEAHDLIEEYPQLKKIADNPGQTAETIARLEARIQTLEKTVEEKTSKVSDIKAQLAEQTAAGSDDLDNLIDEIDYTDGRIKQIEKTCEAIRIAIEVLDESVREYQDAYLVRLSEKASALFEEITGGSYARLKLVEGFVPKLYHAESGVELSPDQMSCGARDQLYFCIRIALAEELAGDVKLPLILDDPFHNYDEGRLTKIWELLKKMESVHQTLLFSHDKHYLSLSQVTVDLNSLRQQPKNDMINP